MLRSPQTVPLCQQFRRNGQTIREPEQLPAVAVLFWGVLLVLFELFKPCQKLRFQRFGHIQDAVGLLGLWLFQDERGLAALTPVRERVVDLLGVELFQSVLVGSLHGLADRDGTTPIGGIKVQITRLQAENFALTERKDHAHVHRQMQGGVLNGLQGCQHGFLVPDGALLDVDLGGLFVLGGLDGDPFVQHLLHRHGVGDKECAVQQFFLDRDLSLLRLLPGLETFPSLAGFAGMVFVLVTDGVGISALQNRCHPPAVKPVSSYDSFK